MTDTSSAEGAKLKPVYWIPHPQKGVLLLPCQPTESVEARKSAVRTPEKPSFETMVPNDKTCLVSRECSEVGESPRCGVSEPKSSWTKSIVGKNPVFRHRGAAS